MENLNELLSKLTEFLKAEVKTGTIIGEQFQLGSYTCVPVMAVGFGLGSGGGEGKGKPNGKAAEGEGSGAGGGAGAGLGPVGFLVTNDKEIQFIPVRSNHGLAALFEKAPEIVGKILDKDKKKEAQEA